MTNITRQRRCISCDTPITNILISAAKPTPSIRSSGVKLIRASHTLVNAANYSPRHIYTYMYPAMTFTRRARFVEQDVCDIATHYLAKNSEFVYVTCQWRMQNLHKGSGCVQRGPRAEHRCLKGQQRGCCS